MKNLGTLTAKIAKKTRKGRKENQATGQAQ
jgi:hypothetical protein